MYNLTKQPQSNQHKVTFKGQYIIIGGQILKFADQYIMNKKLYIPELTLNVNLDDQIQQSDELSYNSFLSQAILTSISKCHPSVGLRILKEFSTFSQANLVYLLHKLTLDKLKDIFMDDQFYLFLWQKLLIFCGINHKQQEIDDLQRQYLGKLNEPYKRLFFIHQNIHSESTLKQAFQQVLQRQVKEILDRPGFLFKIAYSNCQQDEYENFYLEKGMAYQINPNFLVIAKAMLTTLSLIKRCFQNQQSMTQVDVIRQQMRQLYHKILNIQFSKILSEHFHDFFNKDRQSLLELLCLVGKVNPRWTWTHIINKLSQKDKQNQKNDRTMDEDETNLKTSGEHASIFVQMVISSYFDLQNNHRQYAYSLLQDNLINPNESALSSVIQICLYLLDYNTDLKILDMVNLVFKKTSKNTSILFVNIKELISVVLSKFDDQISEIKQKGQLKKRIKFRSNTISTFLRIFSTLLQTELIQTIDSFDFLQDLSLVLKITKRNSGLIQGVRRQFIKNCRRYRQIFELKIKKHTTYISIQKSNTGVQELRAKKIMELKMQKFIQFTKLHTKR